MEMVLSITVCVLSVLVTALLGWQIYNAVTIEIRLKRIIVESEENLKAIIDCKVSKIAGDMKISAGQDSFNQKQYYPAFCRCLESMNLFSVAKDSGGVVMSQWFILQSIQAGDLSLSDDDKIKLKESLNNCYADSIFFGYRDQILKIIV